MPRQSASSTPSYNLLPFNKCIAHQMPRAKRAPGAIEAINCHYPGGSPRGLTGNPSCQLQHVVPSTPPAPCSVPPTTEPALNEPLPPLMRQVKDSQARAGLGPDLQDLGTRLQGPEELGQQSWARERGRRRFSPNTAYREKTFPSGGHRGFQILPISGFTRRRLDGQ